MRRAALLLPWLVGCVSTHRVPFGKFVIETHTQNLGSSCMSSSHSHLYGPDGSRMLEPLSLWELSGDWRWAVAAGRRDERTLHLLDLEGGRVVSTHDRGLTPEPWMPGYALQWSTTRDHLLLERIDSHRTRSLLLFSFFPSLNVRTLFHEEGLRASVHELRQTFWAPDGSGLAFLVSPGPLEGPTRLFYVGFDGAAPKELDRAAGAPNTVAVDWDQTPPKLR